MQNGLKTRQESQLTCSVEKGLEPPFILVSLNLREGSSWKSPNFGAGDSRVQIPALPLTGWVMLYIWQP